MNRCLHRFDGQSGFVNLAKNTLFITLLLNTLSIIMWISYETHQNTWSYIKFHPIIKGVKKRVIKNVMLTLLLVHTNR